MLSKITVSSEYDMVVCSNDTDNSNHIINDTDSSLAINFETILGITIS